MCGIWIAIPPWNSWGRGWGRVVVKWIQETLDFSMPRTFQPSSSSTFPQRCTERLKVRNFGRTDAGRELRKFRTKSPCQTLIKLYITPSYVAYVLNIALGRTKQKTKRMFYSYPAFRLVLVNALPVQQL